MSFNVAAESYQRFMGRFADPLAVAFLDQIPVTAGQRALDVGCGPGALTAQLVQRLGADNVAAVDPSDPFVAALRTRLPGVDVRTAVAEDLPFPDDAFDLTMAQLVVHFMSNPVAGLAEMGRVTRSGGIVAACVWDMYGGSSPLGTFWQAVHDLDPGAVDEAERPGVRQGHLAELCRHAGLSDVQDGSVTVSVAFSDFDEWWEPYTFGVGPSGAYVASLDHAERRRLRDHCAELLPSGAFAISATAWSVTARA